MSEQPNLIHRSDARRLVLALILPWLLLGLAYSLPLVSRELSRAELKPDWMTPLVLGWFYFFGISAVFIAVGLILVGIWRIVRWKKYRYSSYGWLWLLLTWFNCGTLCLATGH
jgi:hypothetical protein